MAGSQHNNSSTETGSVKNRWSILFGILFILFGIGAVFNGVTSLFDNTIRLIAPKGYITVEVVDDNKSRSRGLSGKDQLKNSEGMLFIFDDSSSENCFWMKDMKFAIDMVWLDNEKQVVTVTPSVAPSTYPETFCPEKSAKYGLELGEGRVEKLDIANGSKLRW